MHRIGSFITVRGSGLVNLVPFVMGVIGFTVLDGQPVVDSLFLSMEMYFLNYSDSPPNILIEIARWTAPLMTASGVLMSISKIRGRILQLLRYYRGDSIAVYGDNIHRKEMVQALGSCGIDAGEDWEWVKAKKYLLLGNEDENFRFYGQHREAFAGHTVYLKSENLAAEGILDPHLRLFCPEETAARLYWRRNCLYETSCAHGHRLQIVFLGFELLGEKLLEYALQDNIFDPKQRIEYGCCRTEPETDGTSGRTRTYPVVQVSSVSQLANGNSEKWCEKRCHASDPQGSDSI